MSDINNRFADKIAKINKTDHKIAIEALAVPQIKKSTISQLEERYQQFQTKKIPVAKSMSNEMSAKAQAEQQGLLQKFYINDNKLQLKSIIQNDNQLAVALILVTDVISGIETLEKFENSSAAYGFRVAIENATQVTLTKITMPGQLQTDKKNQQVTLSMYK